jgi:hypothetical protein
MAPVYAGRVRSMFRPTATRTPIRRTLLALALALGGLVLLVLSSGPADADTTFTVNKTGDAGDRRISDTVCDSSRKEGKQCTLRAAIEESNDTPNFGGADLINFNIGGTAGVKTISPNSPLPDITEAVTINGYSQRGASSNTLDVGNNAKLKIQLSGTNAGAGSDANGLVIQASDSKVKGLVINSFDSRGIVVEGFNTTGNKVEGNFIGTNAAGTSALGNGDGVDIQQADDTTVGGTASGARNVISGNRDAGIQIVGDTATGNTVLNNYVGTDMNGTADLGNSGEGVHISDARDSTIGGVASGARNVISGNNSHGVQIQSLFDNPTGNKVQDNFIGTTADGSDDLGNGVDGVQVAGADDNTVGGTASEAGNRIAHNGGDGVSVIVNGAFGDEGAVGNRILGNSIFANTGLGIDLGASGVTANDTDDTDTGANNLQNFPIITSVTQSSSFFNPTRISGTLNSTPNQDFTVQCFLAGEVPADADASSHGEGKFFMAEDTDVRTDADGNADGNDGFECNFLFPVSLEGKRWSATATNEATGETSEFSANFPISSGP